MTSMRSRGVALLAGGFLLSASACTAPAVSGPSGDRARAVVRRGTLEDRFLLTGELRAVRSVPLLTPRTEAWNLTILYMAEEGTRVSPGDPVVQFDSSALTSQLESRRLALLEAEKELERLQVDQDSERHQKLLEAWRRRIERDKAAIEAEVPESLQSARDYQEKQLAFQKASIALEQAQSELAAFDTAARARIEIQELEIATARRDRERMESTIEKLVLRAPVAGVILHGIHPWEGRKFEPGDSAMPGFKVAEVPDPSAMQVTATLMDVDEGKIVPGLPARCILDTYPDEAFAGRVSSVTEYAREAGRRSERRSFFVVVDLDAADPTLMRPGMSVKVEILRRRWEDALLVPRSSVARRGEVYRLLTHDRGLVPVRLDGCSAVECALSKGPSEGTAVEVIR